MDIYAILKDLNIDYIRHDHPAVFTVAEAKERYSQLPGGKSKNLFLKAKSGTYHLVVMDAFKRLDMKSLGTALGAKLSFASPEDLMHYLGLTPGSVSPFGLIHDTEKKVHVIVDQDLWNADPVNFHPNTNTATLELSQADFRKFLDSRGNPVQILSI